MLKAVPCVSLIEVPGKYKCGFVVAVQIFLIWNDIFSFDTVVLVDATVSSAVKNCAIFYAAGWYERPIFSSCVIDDERQSEIEKS